MLEFRVFQLKQEAEALLKLGGSFLDTSNDALGQWIHALDRLCYDKNPNQQSFVIPDEDGLRIRTVASSAYEPDPREGAYRVAGELCFKWDVALLPNPPARTKRKFRVSGNASTKLLIKEVRPNEQDRLLGHWQFELGAADAPGCFFHIGVGQSETPPMHFPKGLSVPRLPSILVTPTDALDFLLGELFQTRWQQRNTEELDEARIWGKHQRHRLRKLLEWKREQLVDQSGSAWNRLKHQRQPRADLFLPSDD